MNEELKFDEVLRTVFGDMDDLLRNIDGHAYKTNLWVREFITDGGCGVYVLANSYETCGHTIIYKYVFSENSVKAVLDSTVKCADERHFSDLPYETVGEMYVSSIREGWKAKEAVLKVHEDEFEHLLQDAQVEMLSKMSSKL